MATTSSNGRPLSNRLLAIRLLAIFSPFNSPLLSPLFLPYNFALLVASKSIVFWVGTMSQPFSNCSNPSNLYLFPFRASTVSAISGTSNNSCGTIFVLFSISLRKQSHNEFRFFSPNLPGIKLGNSMNTNSTPCINTEGNHWLAIR